MDVFFLEFLLFWQTLSIVDHLPGFTFNDLPKCSQRNGIEYVDLSAYLIVIIYQSRVRILWNDIIECAFWFLNNFCMTSKINNYLNKYHCLLSL